MKTGDIPGKTATTNSKADQSDKIPSKFHRMVYATDLSDRSGDAIRYAVNYASRHNAKLIVFHVINQRSITCSKILATFFNEGQEGRIKQKKVSLKLILN